jgi:uncharacterized protein (TIGR02646 family)
MTPCQRTPIPAILVQYAKEFTDAWVAKRSSNPKGDWNWPQRNSVKSDEEILKSLEQMTDGHCSFCDSYPIDGTGRKEIEHFKSKTSHPMDAFDWANLYLSCSACNGKKKNQFSEHLLRPDDSNYRFGHYFFLQADGKLIPHPGMSAENQLCANTTIEIFGLNRRGLVTERERQMSRPSECVFRFIG